MEESHEERDNFSHLKFIRFSIVLVFFFHLAKKSFVKKTEYFLQKGNTENDGRITCAQKNVRCDFVNMHRSPTQRLAKAFIFVFFFAV